MQLDFERYECKYLIPGHLCAPIRRFIAPYTEPDEYTAASGPDGYLITSLYLDNSQLSFHLAKSHKQRNRMKLRIRTYGEIGKHPTFFEIKRKFNGVIHKRRVQVCNERWFLQWERGESFVAKDNPRNQDVIADFLAQQAYYTAEPAILVRYKREAYASFLETYGRVTFDRQIEGHLPQRYQLDVDPTSWFSIDDPVAFEAPDSWVILELKFAAHPPVWMLDLIAQFGLRQRGFSKYSSAIERGLALYMPHDIRIPAYWPFSE